MSLRVFTWGLWEANRPGESMEGSRGREPTVCHQLVSAEGWSWGVGQQPQSLRSQCSPASEALWGGLNTLQVFCLVHELLSFLRKPQSFKGKNSIHFPSMWSEIHCTMSRR